MVNPYVIRFLAYYQKGWVFVQSKADLGRRVVAALIDGVIAAVIATVPFIGALIATAYTLTKDAIVYELTKQDEWKNRSIGKKLLNLEVATLDGGDVDLIASAKRNAPLAIGYLLGVVPLLGLLVGGLLSLAISAIEIALVVTDNKGRRLGDRWAATQVVDVDATEVLEAGEKASGDD